VKVFTLILFFGVFVFSLHTAAAAFYPFGGIITAYLPPLPSGPCTLPSIVVGPPFGGTFMVPPATLFPFFNLTIGHYVLGVASLPFCGAIYFVGTSL